MNKEFLKRINKEVKKEFLAKLQSGDFILQPAYEPQPELTFDLQESGLYKCQETGQELTLSELESLPGYRMDLQLVSTRLQVSGVEPPDTIKKIPFLETEYLDSLLRSKSDKLLTFDESDGKFKTENDSYSFDQLMRFNHSNPEVHFVMNELTGRKYIECLKNWC